ncbi:MAG TPA: hypothetical protein VFS11_03905 [Gemmatimonadales bacterium]|nr:hypothetical protein [Gemmatimonadales bacterium]
MKVPELGPALGRLTARPEPPPPGSWVALDDLRVELVNRLFESAGVARAFAEADDRSAAVASLGRAELLAAWERIVAEATSRLAKAVEVRLGAAAAESRLPAKRRAALVLGEADRRAIAGRLGGGALPFLQSVERLEQAARAAAAPGPRGEAAEPEWREALLGTARRLESAWLALAAAARAEQEVWTPEIERVRAWRRPTRLLWIGSGVVVAAAVTLGLMLGGYIPVPAALHGLAWAWWSVLP